MASNLPMTILVLGGGVSMVWVGVVNPAGGLVGVVQAVLKGKPLSAIDKGTAAADAAAVLNAGGQAAGSVGGAYTAAVGGIVKAAASQLGVKYVYGGGGANGPTHGGFDCSGLTQYAAKQGAGIDIPRTAETQRLALARVAASQTIPGDLVFFGAPAYHCGVNAGNGQMIHAPHTGTVVKYEAISDVHPGPVNYGRVGSVPST